MKERWWGVPTEEARELDLAAGGLEKIDATDHHGNSLLEVIDRRRELVRPVTVPVADEEVATLLGGDLCLKTESEVVEAFFRSRKMDANPAAGCFGESFVTARSGIPEFVGGHGGRTSTFAGASARLRQRRCRGHFAAATRTRVDEPLLSQARESTLVDLASFTLANGCLIGPESQPLEVFENRRFVLVA